MEVNVLGTEYTIKKRAPSDDKELKDADGYTMFYDKIIIISDLSDWDGATKEAKEVYTRQILRHEITHAFLYESGLAFNSKSTEKWAVNEEMVDWIAIQMPKIMAAYDSITKRQKLKFADASAMAPAA